MRTPRHYAGIQNPAKKMADLLPSALADLNKKMKDPREEILRVWNELIGEKMAHLTEVVSFVDGVLTVKVKSSTLYSLLATHERKSLLAKLQDQFSIRNLVLRVG